MTISYKGEQEEKNVTEKEEIRLTNTIPNITNYLENSAYDKSKTTSLVSEFSLECSKIFRGKQKDYGSSWKTLRPISLIDQIMIKLLRIRALEEKKENVVGDSIFDELKGIFNYSVIGLIQSEFKYYETITDNDMFDNKDQECKYICVVNKIEELYNSKNSDYSDAWKMMDVKSFTDIMLVKINRMKKMLTVEKLTCSEPIESSFMDIAIYSCFYLHNIKPSKTWL